VRGKKAEQHMSDEQHDTLEWLEIVQLASIAVKNAGGDFFEIARALAFDEAYRDTVVRATNRPVVRARRGTWEFDAHKVLRQMSILLDGVTVLHHWVCATPEGFLWVTGEHNQLQYSVFVIGESMEGTAKEFDKNSERETYVAAEHWLTKSRMRAVYKKAQNLVVSKSEWLNPEYFRDMTLRSVWPWNRSWLDHTEWNEETSLEEIFRMPSEDFIAAFPPEMHEEV
jgi:hypothetical protein